MEYIPERMDVPFVRICLLKYLARYVSKWKGFDEKLFSTSKINRDRNRDCIKAAITTGGAAAFEYAAKGSRLNPELLYHAVEKHAGEALNKAADAYRTSSPGSRKQAFIEKEKKRIESHGYVEGAEAPDFRHPVVLGEERD